MATEKKPPLIKLMTQKGIARFPALIVPDTKFNPEGEYKIGVILPADAKNVADGANKGKVIMTMLEDAQEKIYQDTKTELEESIKTLKGEKLAKAKKALAELKKGDLPAKPVYDEDGNETGDIVINFKMKATRKDKDTGAVKKLQPSLFDAKGKPMARNKEIWGGSEVCVAGSLNPFYIPGTNTCGVGIRLAAVQVITLRSAGGGDAASYGFGSHDDGYDASEDAQESSEDASSETAEEDNDDF